MKAEVAECRRGALKMRCPKGRGGSSPPFGIEIDAPDTTGSKLTTAEIRQQRTPGVVTLEADSGNGDKAALCGDFFQTETSMAKVVGKDEKAYRRVTCRQCASIIEYLPIEVKKNTYTDYGGGSDTVYWIECPECGKDVTVSRN